MQLVLVDTNVVSFIFKQDTREALYKPHLSNKQACIAFMTVAETYRWAITAKWGQRRIDDLKQELSRYVVLPFDDETAWMWGQVRTLKGIPVDSSDAWIAAIALRHKLPLVTHNRRHFEQIPGLVVISEA